LWPTGQDTITVIDATTRAIIGSVDLRNSLANDPIAPGISSRAGSRWPWTTPSFTSRVFLSFTKPGDVRAMILARKSGGGARHQHEFPTTSRTTAWRVV